MACTYDSILTYDEPTSYDDGFCVCTYDTPPTYDFGVTYDDICTPGGEPEPTRRHLPWDEWLRAELDAEDTVILLAMAEALL